MLKPILLVSTFIAGIAATAAGAQVGALISREQLGKIIAMLDTSGKEIPLDQNVTNALGLTRGSAKISPRQIAVQDENGIVHAFIRLDKGGGYLLGRVADAGVVVIRASAEWKLMSAILKAPGGTQTATLPRPDAQQRFEEELRQWAKIADQL
ncbi:MAG TPA: hypothetical protein VMU06_12705 [Stellaceae bacterium]|nr:hypothetical protein [Stellaceae bacterium]